MTIRLEANQRKKVKVVISVIRNSGKKKEGREQYNLERVSVKKQGPS